jgi:hypothetical protein
MPATTPRPQSSEQVAAFNRNPRLETETAIAAVAEIFVADPSPPLKNCNGGSEMMQGQRSIATGLKTVRAVSAPLFVFSHAKRRPLGAQFDSRNAASSTEPSWPWRECHRFACRWNIDYVNITLGEHNAV